MSIEKIETGMRKWLLLATPMDPWPHCDPEHVRALLDELSRLREALEAADAIRAAQRAYMADRGNEAKGKAVGEAAAAYDRLRALSGREGQDG